MAQRRDLLSRLTDAGEEALHRLGDAPGGQRVVELMEDVKKRVRGLDELEKRLAALERRLDALEKAKRPRAPAKKPARKAT